MNEEQRKAIIEQASRRQQQKQVAPPTAAAPESGKASARVVRTTGDVQVRIVDANNPPTEPKRISRGGTRMQQAQAPGRGVVPMGARVVDPVERSQTTRMKTGRPAGVYGANVISEPAAKPPLGQALRTPMAPGGVDMKARIESMGRSAKGGAANISVEMLSHGALDDVTIIMSQHMRPETLAPQYQTLLASGAKDYNLICWINPAKQRLNDGLLQQIRHVKSNRDMGPWMRWTLVSAVPTKYTCVIDDDCLPGPQWLALARDRLEAAEQAGDKLVVAAAGTIYNSDRPDDVLLVGFESLRPEELDVDVGRGAWLMRTDHARAVLNYPFVGCPLATGLHVSAALQHEGVSIVVLPYQHGKRESWGMLEERKEPGSLSFRFDQEASAGQGPTAQQLKHADYDVYRSVGWEPRCVMLAAASTARMTVSELADAPSETTPAS